MNDAELWFFPAGALVLCLQALQGFRKSSDMSKRQGST